MKRKLTFLMLFMTLCSMFSFGQNHWTPVTGFEDNMSLTSVIHIDGVKQENTNLELGAFYGDEVRGSAKVVHQIINLPNGITIDAGYLVYLQIQGTIGESYTFKVYNHSSQSELSLISNNTIEFNENYDYSDSNPYVINFITPVAEVNGTVYGSLTEAIEKADATHGVKLLSSVTLDAELAIAKDININLNDNAIIGTVKLNVVGATITGTAEEMNVVSGVENYVVNFDENSQTYSLVERSASGTIAYRAYIGDTDTRENIQVDLQNVYAKQSVVVKLFDKDGNLLTITSLKAGAANNPEYLTCNIVLWGSASSSWETVINAEKLTVDNYPHKAELLIDGNFTDTFENILGNATDAAVYQLPVYLALDCVYKEAQIGDTYYATLKKAFEAANANATVKVVTDLNLSETIKVNNNITLDLNGKTITGTDNATGSFALFEVQPSKEFTISDATNSGKITLTATNNRGWGGYSSVISNQRAKLTVNGGTIEHLGGTDMAYGIDNLTNGKGTYAETVINGGYIKSTYRAIRQFLNGAENAQNILTVNGGTIEGTNKSIWMQDANANANPGTLTVGANAKLYGDVYLSVAAGSTEWPVEVSIAKSALQGESTVQTNDNVPFGYELVLTDGVYGVVYKEAGAQVAYRAYVHDNDNFEGLGVDLENVLVQNSLKVELYSGEELLTTTTYAKEYPINATSFSCLIVLDGQADEYWNTTKSEGVVLTVANIPTTIKVYVDGELVDTYENALGAGTNVDETAKYKALDCVLDTPVAKVGNTEYYTIESAVDNWKNNTTLTLLANVTLSEAIQIKSEETHTLDLATFTITAAEGQNAIEIIPATNKYGKFTINADATNPGGITANSKNCIHYNNTSTNDLPTITINGGVFNGNYSIYCNKIKTPRGDSPKVIVNNGTFNATVKVTFGALYVNDGFFNCEVTCTGADDGHGQRLISGGTFKSWGFMTADAPNKFTVGSTWGTYDRGVYVDENGYLVVGGPVVTEAGETFEASSANYSGWSSYLKYSSAAANNLYYTSVEEAFDDNKNTTSSVNIFVDELDLTNTSYKGSIVIAEDLTVSFAEGTTPAWTVKAVEGLDLGYTETVTNGKVTRNYSVGNFVAAIGTAKYATLKAAIDAAQPNETIELLDNYSETLSEVLLINKSLTINGNNKTLTSSASRVIRLTASDINVTINNLNLVSTAERVGTNDIRGISIDASLENVKLALVNCSVDFQHTTANDWTYAVNISGNGTGHALTINGGTYEGANVVNVHGANNAVVVKDATLTSLYPNNDIYSGATIWVLQENGSSVTATGNTFNGGNAVAFNLGTGTELTESNNTDNTTVVVAKVGETYYTSVNTAINEAADGATVQLLNRTISEYIAPWSNDSQHNSEKSITILGYNNGDFKTTLTGGMYLGYDDSQCRNHNIVVKNINFEGKGLKVACQKNVTIEGNNFNNITDSRAIAVIGKDINATVNGNNIDGVEIGIELRNMATATIIGNVVKNTSHNSVQVTAANPDADVTITENTLENWANNNTEGRAIRISGGDNIIVNNNKMTKADAPESFVKITKLGETVQNINASQNYWNGENPLALFETDAANDPVSYLVNYYADAEMQQLIPLSASIAKVGNEYYQTLQAAVDAAQAGETVTLLANAAGAGVVIDKNVTIDFATFAYTVNGGVGSTGTETNGFQILEGNNVTLTGGTLNAGEGIKILVQNYSNLTVNDMTLNGTSEMVQYVLSNNSGKVNVIGETNITAHTNGVAFDVCKFQSYEEPIVNVNTTGVVTGKIEVTTTAQTNLNISAGTFTVEIAEAWCAEGFIPTQNADGTWTVKSGAYVARINDGQGYETLAVAFNAAQNGDEVKILAAGTYALSTSGKNITITAAVDGVVFDNIGAKNMNGANVIFNNVTFDYYPNVNYTGLQHSGNLVYNNCIINGQVFLYGTSETFNGCTFNQNSADAYNVWTYGAADVDFNKCTFNSVGKSVLIYAEGATIFNDVIVTDCDFIASAPVDGKAAIEMDSSLTKGINLTIDGETTATGFDEGNVSGNSLWNNKKGNDTEANNDITVVVDGETVLAPLTLVAEVGGTKYTSLQAAIDAVADKGTVTLLADFEEAVSFPILEKEITINGNGKTMNGLSFGKDINTLDNGKVTITNVKFTDAGLTVKELAAVIVTNCNFTTINGDAIAVLSDNLTETITITNNVIEGTTGAGINLRTPKAVTVTDNVIRNTGGNSMTFQHGATYDAEGNIVITGNLMENWANNATEGRAIRLATGTKARIITVEGNAMVKENAPEEFVKITTGTGSQATISIDGNYWNGQSPLNENVYLVEGVFPANYYGKYTYENNVLTLSDEISLNYVAQVGNVKYTNLVDAINAATSSNAVVLLSDVTLSEILVIEKGVQINADGHTLTSTADRAINISTTEEVVINGLTIATASNTERAINVVQKAANLKLQNVTAEGFKYTINVASSSEGSTITTNGGKFIGYAAVNIAGNNTKFTASNTEFVGVNNYVQNAYNNYAVIAVNNPAEGIKVNITGGKLTATTNGNRQFIVTAANVTDTEITIDAELVLADGDVFNGDAEDVTAKFRAYYADALNAQGYAVSTATEGLVTVLGAAVAAVEGTNYATLQAAIDAAQAGETVYLLKSVTGAGVVINKDVTIDFATFTYTFNEGVGSTGTETLGFQILKNNEVKLKNGTLTSVAAVEGSKEIKMLIQNYANLTLTDMNLVDATDHIQYVLSNNSGESYINGATSITTNAVAFDVYDYSSAGYAVPTVNVNITGIITGAIEVSETATLNIYDGSFIATIAEAWCAEGYIPTTEVIDGVTYNTVKEGKYIAQTETGAKFETLQDAVNAGTTVTLLDNVTGAGVVINKDVTIDFATFTYTFNEGVGSAGTKTIGFQILKDNNVTLKSGTLTSTAAVEGSKEIKMLIQNYANLTLTDMNLVDATDHILYVLSNNSGESYINGATSITTDAVAFDVYDYSSAGYAVPTVNVNTKGTIAGAIEVSESISTNLNISAGTFTNEIIEDWCAEFYSPVYNETDRTWTVALTGGVQETELAKGWNWFSSYVDLSDENGLETLQNALGTSGLQIKSQVPNHFSAYSEEYQEWYNNPEFTALYKERMYMIQTSAAVNLELSGDFVDYEETPIQVYKGWNWISYPVDKEVNIEEALKNLEASDNDIVKMHGTTFAAYYGGKWQYQGEISTLKPGQGYMYYRNAANATQFVYNVPAENNRTDVAAVDYRWTAASAEYANNMTITAMLSVDGELVRGDYEISAIVNGEVRGSARPVYIESLDAYMLFMTVFGDDVEEITFMYYDVDTDTEYVLDNLMNYSTDAIVGSIEEPYMFNLNILGIGETSIDEISIYPNPTTTGREIDLQATCDKVEVYNALGVKVSEYTNVDSIDAIETAGIYVIRVTIDGNVRNCRLIVK